MEATYHNMGKTDSIEEFRSENKNGNKTGSH
jgi:hypothetical protein